MRLGQEGVAVGRNEFSDGIIVRLNLMSVFTTPANNFR
jgi:hypothetical protein